ncbi:MAG: hypothetical protein IT303_04210 [Dehalococcoidia bacterium]|nr:hypothetical protein [Dehalococcoidia bacterium]
MPAITIRHLVLLASVVGLVVVGYLAAMDRSSADVQDPDAGLIDAERMAKHAELSAKSDAMQRAKAAEFLSSGSDLATLERVPMLVSYGTISPSLEDAAKEAEFVVDATVASVSIGSVVDLSQATIEPNETLIGDEQKSIRIVQSGGLEWHEAEGRFVLVEPEAVPLLMQGERVILLLIREPALDRDDSPAYSILPFRGLYWVTNGTIRTFEGNPDHHELNGLSVDSFKAKLAPAR